MSQDDAYRGSVQSRFLAARDAPLYDLHKKPFVLVAINMNFDYVKSFEMNTRPAYERLLLDCLKGDLTLFARADEVEAMWDVVDPIIGRWESVPAKDFPNYTAGSEGPKEASELIKADGRAWRRI